METNNKNQTFNQPPVQSFKPTGKWYVNKGVIAIIVLSIITVGVSYLSLNKSVDIGNGEININQEPVPTQIQVTEQTQDYTPPSNKPFSPDFDKYGLFLDTSYKIISIQYTEHGKVESGEYINYTRVLAEVQFDEPGGPVVYVFMTKDFKTYILDKKDESEYKNPGSVFNKTNVVNVDTVPIVYPPSTIDLDRFVIVGGYIITNANLNTELSSSVPGFKFWGNGYQFATASTTLPDFYLSGLSKIYLEDKYGIYFSYDLLSKELLGRKKVDEYDRNFYTKSEIQTSQPLFTTYGKLFPGGCGLMDETYVLKNVSNQDLEKVGKTSQGQDLFSLKDKNHLIYKEQYNDKVLLWMDQFKDLNNIDPPTFEDYVAKNPVLIFKDAWNRWVGLGETELVIAGGCGKPVVYLYANEPTEVTVKFKNPMNFSVDIPKYDNGWVVYALPNGILKDLKPELTDCNKINYRQKGSDYALNACEKNSYPYLYWAGQTVGDYPSANKGWVVSRQDIKSFLNDKLNEVGLNETEKSDMLEYWIPELLKKDAPYYRMSFFLTNTMNRFIPMEITPKPDTLIRVFLDWEGLQNMPNEPIEPQILNYTNRTGFTVVEWGGLK